MHEPYRGSPRPRFHTESERGCATIVPLASCGLLRDPPRERGDEENGGVFKRIMVLHDVSATHVSKPLVTIQLLYTRAVAVDGGDWTMVRNNLRQADVYERSKRLRSSHHSQVSGSIPISGNILVTTSAIACAV